MVGHYGWAIEWDKMRKSPSVEVNGTKTFFYHFFMIVSSMRKYGFKRTHFREKSSLEKSIKVEIARL